MQPYYYQRDLEEGLVEVGKEEEEGSTFLPAQHPFPILQHDLRRLWTFPRMVENTT